MQDNNQLDDTYGHTGSQRIQSVFFNKFVGASSGSGKEYGSKLIGMQEKEIFSENKPTSTHDRGTSSCEGEGMQRQNRIIFSPQDFLGFEPGEFAGCVAESDERLFHHKIKNVARFDKKFTNEALKDLPILSHSISLEANYQKIEQEVLGLFKKRGADNIFS